MGLLIWAPFGPAHRMSLADVARTRRRCRACWAAAGPCPTRSRPFLSCELSWRLFGRRRRRMSWRGRPTGAQVQQWDLYLHGPVDVAAPLHCGSLHAVRLGQCAGMWCLCTLKSCSAWPVCIHCACVPAALTALVALRAVDVCMTMQAGGPRLKGDQAAAGDTQPGGGHGGGAGDLQPRAAPLCQAQRYRLLTESKKAVLKAVLKAEHGMAHLVRCLPQRQPAPLQALVFAAREAGLGGLHWCLCSHVSPLVLCRAIRTGVIWGGGRQQAAGWQHRGALQPLCQVGQGGLGGSTMLSTHSSLVVARGMWFIPTVYSSNHLPARKEEERPWKGRWGKLSLTPLQDAQGAQGGVLDRRRALSLPGLLLQPGSGQWSLYRNSVAISRHSMLGASEATDK